MNPEIHDLIKEIKERLLELEWLVYNTEGEYRELKDEVENERQV